MSLTKKLSVSKIFETPEHLNSKSKEHEIFTDCYSKLEHSVSKIFTQHFQHSSDIGDSIYSIDSTNKITQLETIKKRLFLDENLRIGIFLEMKIGPVGTDVKVVP